jgi:2-haloacid dehalogenase
LARQVAREAGAFSSHRLQTRLARLADAWRTSISLRWRRCAPDIPAQARRLHRRNLDRILPRLGISGLARTQRASSISRGIASTHGLTPRGLARLKGRFVLAPVSNGNISLMVDLARRNGFPWDAVLGAETAGDYKPMPRVYLSACEALDLSPGSCMMVAAHTTDLLAAAKVGLRTAHIARPNERGPGKGEAKPHAPVDVAGADLEDLAVRLGA